MIRHLPRCLALTLLAVLPAALHAQTGKRVALVIGNDAYTVSALKNAVNDARVMDRALKSAGFQSTLVENARKADMDRVIGEFLDKIGPDDTALFYYAGHGVQIESENFLVPVDFTPGATISGAKFACLSLAQVFDELKRKRAKQSIVILDACRSNPVQAKYSLEGGLAKPQDAPRETFIAYSTSPGQTAADNPNGQNSWFTEAFADYIEQSSLTIELNEVLTRVRKRVSDATEGRQTPWTTSSLTSAFYFHLPSGAISADTSLPEKWLNDAVLREQREQWSEAATLMERILERKPGGRVEEAARARLPYLNARRDAQARFDAGDFAAAATLYRQSLQADPFAFSAALQAVNCYLVADRIPDALEFLKTMRARGDSRTLEVANRMLKELATVSEPARAELAAAQPAPPPIQELFPELKTPAVDPQAGRKYVAANPPDLTRWTKDLKMEVAMPVLPALPGVTTAAAAQPAGLESGPAPVAVSIAEAATTPTDAFHLEVVPTAETRNLRLRQPASTDEFGFIQFDGPASPVVFEGTQLVLPAKLKLPAGKYEVRAVEKGKLLNSQPIEVTPLSTLNYQVKRP